MEIYGHHFENTDAQLPPGFRFHPTDEELITYYLLKKVLDGSFTSRAIAEIDLNKCEPWELPGKAKMGEKEWYFFSLRDRKYPTGLRTNRATLAGYWKATGKDREILNSRSSTVTLVGMKKTLVFYRGRAPKGEKSNWVMHEYRLDGKFAYHFISRSSKDEWVVCRVFQKNHGGGGGGGGGKKSQNRVGSLGIGVSSYSDAGSPSSTSLPPLLDTSPYATAAVAAVTDKESCSYESSGRDHVPCFSTVSAAASAGFNLYHPLVSVPPMPNMVGGGGPTAFPSMRNLQDNLHMPFFFSSLAPLPAGIGQVCDDHRGEMGGGGGSWGCDVERKVEVNRAQQLQVGATELDCLWSY